MYEKEKEDKPHDDVLPVGKRHIQSGQQVDHETDREIKFEEKRKMDVQGDDGEATGDHEMAMSRQQRRQRWMGGGRTR